MKTYRDHYFLKAKQENYPARSVYKLQELDAKFKLFKPGMKVLDLGATPGSWSLWAAQHVGASGLVLACDLQDTQTVFPPNVRFAREDIFAPSSEFERALAETGPFDLVMSDMAPSTTGTKFTDQARSFDLCVEALNVARRCLKPGGAFIAKIFMGPDVPQFAAELRKNFSTSKSFKPKSSRAESREIFYVGTGYSAKDV